MLGSKMLYRFWLTSAGIFFLIAALAPGFTAPFCQPSAALAASVAAPQGIPQISGETAVVLDGANGDMLFDKMADERVPPASLTKIATAIVAIEKGRLNDRIHIDFDSYTMVIESQSSIMGLKLGDEPSLEDLLYGLMLPSGNDAAVVIARHVGGTEERFVAMMNEKVAELGLKNTHFSNPHGLHAAEHYSSAYDMAALSRYAMRNPVFAKIAGAVRYAVVGPRAYEVWNLNRLLYTYDGADGVKIGFTEQALETIVGSAKRGNYSLIVAVMRSNDRLSDSRRLLDFFFEAIANGPVERRPAPTPTSTPSPTPSPTPERFPSQTDRGPITGGAEEQASIAPAPSGDADTSVSPLAAAEGLLRAILSLFGR